MASKEYKTFKEFYPFYLSQHQNKMCRILHFTGTLLLLVILVLIMLLDQWKYFWVIPTTGYGFAWIGHFFYEKNKPATFQYPLYSLGSDFKLFYELLIGKRKILRLKLPCKYDVILD